MKQCNGKEKRYRVTERGREIGKERERERYIERKDRNGVEYQWTIDCVKKIVRIRQYKTQNESSASQNLFYIFP